ncbi:MAG: diacylglycerol kinase family protein [Saprospiraceae bacterium]|nr:diacylglycerol kinase family protein [Saprospiraceae bacterium]
MDKASFSMKARIRSFKYAFNGISLIFRHHNAIIHLIAAGVVITMSLICGLNSTEWCIVLLCIGFVISAEGINTSIEYLADIVSPEFDQRIKKVKDVAAASVLISAIISFAIGLIIFLPKL